MHADPSNCNTVYSYLYKLENNETNKEQAAEKEKEFTAYYIMQFIPLL